MSDVDPVVTSFGAALVAAMATHEWSRAHAGVVAVWRRYRRDDPIAADLDALRERVTGARRAGRADVEDALVRIWQARALELLMDHPEAGDELRALLERVPAPAASAQVTIGRVTMRGEAHGTSTFNQFVGDQHYHDHRP